MTMKVAGPSIWECSTVRTTCTLVLCSKYVVVILGEISTHSFNILAWIYRCFVPNFTSIDPLHCLNVYHANVRGQSHINSMTYLYLLHQTTVV